MTKPLRIPCGYVGIATPSMRWLEVVYGGLLSDGSESGRRAIVSHLEQLIHTGEVDAVLVNGVRPEDQLLSQLTEVAWCCERSDRHWVTRLEMGSFDRTMEFHSGKHRKKLRRYDRVLQQAFAGDVSLHSFSEVDDVQRFLVLASEVSAQSYLGAMGAGVADNALWRSIITLEAQRGRMLSYVLLTGGRPIAYQNGVLYGDTYYCDERAYVLKYGGLRPGTVLAVRMLKDLCSRPVHWIDYGFGDAEYKRIYGTNSWEETRLYMYAPRVRPLLVFATQRAGSVLSRWATSATKTFGVFERVRRTWRAKMVRVDDRD
ncbi:MAG: GNAT family N-acetyltransferase [Phycisphaerae bacterium]|nr:GNAT family N-acetyltransferase [Phycisphaerae bacterium]